MAQILDGRAVSSAAAVESITKAQRVAIAPRGYAYGGSGMSGTIAATFASGGTLFSMRNDASSSKRVFVERIRLQYCTQTVYTTPLNVGRRLHLVRSTASSANPSGGTAIVPIAKNSLHTDSECSTAGGGDCRIASTGVLTITGTTWDTNVIKTMFLGHVGASGAHVEFVLDLSSSANAPIVLEPGQALGIVAGQAFDAAGTWTASIDVDWHEAVLWDATTSE
jgi:hypothetical protein